ncbi:MAG TPA: PP2C family serine/threonine-protein phosphatase [Blastocatellia bacterium]|nr:PP2C family serine/threonine-protein phosphatase [Blastocatellia bacterium]
MWQYVFSSVAGTAHAKASLPVQDACRAEVVTDARGAEVLIAVASDGAGSAAHGRTGSKLACELLADEVRAHLAEGGDCARLAGGFIEDWVVKYQRLIARDLGGDGPERQDFACTLVAAVVEREQAAYFQIGDGAIVASSRDARDDYQCVCWPQRGEYANTTNFLTDLDAADKIFRQLQPAAIEELALFTDGLQSLVLNYRTRSAHLPFFAPLFAWLRSCREGHSPELSNALAGYLDSEKINARTDDDKTLILATRRSLEKSREV